MYSIYLVNFTKTSTHNFFDAAQFCLRRAISGRHFLINTRWTIHSVKYKIENFDKDLKYICYIVQFYTYQNIQKSYIYWLQILFMKSDSIAKPLISNIFSYNWKTVIFTYDYILIFYSVYALGKSHPAIKIFLDANIAFMKNIFLKSWA